VLLVGAAAHFVARSGDDPAPLAAIPAAAPRSDPPAIAVKPGRQLDPAVERVAQRFMLATLGREHLDEAWALATGALRAGVSREQWLRGELPIAPFPVKALQTDGFTVVGETRDKVLLQVLLVPEESTGYVPTRYDMTLVKVGAGARAAWKISYFLPYAPPGLFSDNG
jgi:hypothetical protein